ncbi:hypothetical protein [Idiomarina sp.]|uniref:hypothetical protein n=1 Tax=Idiomarina sp. TaxID=1874361 RepID=UPI0035137ED7
MSLLSSELYPGKLIRSSKWRADPVIDKQILARLISLPRSILRKLLISSVTLNSDITKLEQIPHIEEQVLHLQEARLHIRADDETIYACIPCLKQQVHHFGFYYFKAEWLNDNFCKAHCQALTRLEPATGSVEELESTVYLLINSISTLHTHLFESKNALISRSRKTKVIVAPCLLPITKLLLTDLTFFPAGYNETVDYTGRFQHLYKAINKKRLMSSMDHQFCSFFTAISVKQFKDFMKKLTSNAQVIEHVALSDESREVWKSARAKCDQCTLNMAPSKLCSYSKLIYKQHNDCVLKFKDLPADTWLTVAAQSTVPRLNEPIFNKLG